MHVHNYIEHWINETDKKNWGRESCGGGGRQPSPPPPELAPLILFFYFYMVLLFDLLWPIILRSIICGPSSWWNLAFVVRIYINLPSKFVLFLIRGKIQNLKSTMLSMTLLIFGCIIFDLIERIQFNSICHCLHSPALGATACQQKMMAINVQLTLTFGQKWSNWKWSTTKTTTLCDCWSYYSVDGAINGKVYYYFYFYFDTSQIF